MSRVRFVFIKWRRSTKVCQWNNVVQFDESAIIYYKNPQKEWRKIIAGQSTKKKSEQLWMRQTKIGVVVITILSGNFECVVRLWSDLRHMILCKCIENSTKKLKLFPFRNRNVSQWFEFYTKTACARHCVLRVTYFMHWKWSDGVYVPYLPRKFESVLSNLLFFLSL